MSDVLLMVLPKGDDDAPVLGEGFEIYPSDAGWYELVDLGYAYRAGDYDEGTALYWMCSDNRAQLDEWADDAVHFWTLTALKADESEEAKEGKKRIKHWRIDGSMTLMGRTQTLTDYKATLNVPLPTLTPSVAEPLVQGNMTVTNLIRPVLGATIAGYDYMNDAETTT